MTTRRPDPPAGTDRAARLAAALRANLARRKAQARSRADDADPAADPGDAAGDTTEHQPPAAGDSPDRADESEG